MFNIGLSEVLVVALVSIIVLDKSKVSVFLNLIKNIYRYFWVVKSRVRKLLKDTGIKELYEEHNVEKVNYIIGEDGKLYPAYNVDNTKDDSKDPSSR
ncbi:Sec-independent protein translocase subunit TatB [Wolbachia endosymbiont of Protocalliphora sialia]